MAGVPRGQNETTDENEKNLSNDPATTKTAVPAIPTGVPEGLEDIDPTDVTMPIFRINHRDGTFINGLTGEEFAEFDAVILGVIKQRILWPREVGDEGEAPMCRSYDHKVGYPRSETWVRVQPKTSETAQRSSGFTWDQVEAADPMNQNTGLVCANCNLQQWGDGRTPPWCNEQWTMPFARLIDGGDPMVGVISFQRTGLKPCKSYVSAFVQARSPLFTVITRIKAIKQTRGTVEWVVPSFQRIADSDAVQWPMFAENLHNVKAFLTTPRTFTDPDPDEDEVTAVTSTVATASKPAASGVAPEPGPPELVPEHQPPTQATQEVTGHDPQPVKRAKPAPVQAEFEDEEPFASILRPPEHFDRWS